MNVNACRIKYLQIVSFLEIEENTRHCIFINISSYYDQLLRSKSIQVHEYFRFVSKTLFEFRSIISRVNDSRVKLARVEARRTSRGGIEPRSVSIVGEIIFHRRGEKSGCSRRGKDSRDACWSLRFAYESRFSGQHRLSFSLSIGREFFSFPPRRKTMAVLSRQVSRGEHDQWGSAQWLYLFSRGWKRRWWNSWDSAFA